MARPRPFRTLARPAVAAFLLVLVASSCGGARAHIAPPDRAGGHARNVILFIGDGMGPEQVRAAGMYAAGEAGSLAFEAFPFRGTVSTANAEGGVTDSAAAATAMATGVKVQNGVLSVALPGNGNPLPTILERLKAEGKGTGLVTTTALPHATPAAFAAHEPSRENYAAIAASYLGPVRPEVLFGGGDFIDAADARRAGYLVVTDRAGLFAVGAGDATRVCGLFGDDHLPFEYDGQGPFPRLSEMTQVALRLLETSPAGFFLMVEGGRIDHACHANDIARTVHETIGLSDAVARAVEWAKDRTDTLILVTADHETGGLQVIAGNGAGALPSVSWGTADHTAADVPCYGLGPGAERIPGRLENTDIFRILRDAAGNGRP
jgi:alkaline phosphatase